MDVTGKRSQNQAPPSFDLMVKKFGDAPSPSFTKQWDKKASQYGQGQKEWWLAVRYS